MNDYQRLQAAAMHEYGGADELPITHETTVRGSDVLCCDGFYLCINRSIPFIVWQTRSREMKTARDLEICQRLLQRAKQIMGGVRDECQAAD